MPQSLQAQILDNVIKLSEGQAAMKERVDLIDTKLERVEKKLDDHLVNDIRPMDDHGKYVERRNGFYKFKKKIPMIALVLSILTFLGGWSACEYVEGYIHKIVVDYSLHLDSE